MRDSAVHRMQRAKNLVKLKKNVELLNVESNLYTLLIKFKFYNNYSNTHLKIPKFLNMSSIVTGQGNRDVNNPYDFNGVQVSHNLVYIDACSSKNHPHHLTREMQSDLELK